MADPIGRPVAVLAVRAPPAAVLRLCRGFRSSPAMKPRENGGALLIGRGPEQDDGPGTPSTGK